MRGANTRKRHQLLLTLVVLFAYGLMLVGLPTKAAAVSGTTITALMNQKRSAAGLSALRYNGTLSTSAYLKAKDMCAKHYWAHTSPSGLTPWYFMRQAGYAYVAAGKATQGFTTDSGVVNAWMGSAGHRANILSSTYRDVGVASMQCTLISSPTTVVVAHFGSTGYSAPAPTRTTTYTAPKAPTTTYRAPTTQTRVNVKSARVQRRPAAKKPVLKKVEVQINKPVPFGQLIWEMTHQGTALRPVILSWY